MKRAQKHILFALLVATILVVAALISLAVIPSMLAGDSFYCGKGSKNFGCTTWIGVLLTALLAVVATLIGYAWGRIYDRDG